MKNDFDHFSGTQSMSGDKVLDLTKLESWLHNNITNFKGPLSVDSFKGGQSNPTYLLITPSKNYVLRSKPAPAAKLLPSAHAIEREFKIMTGLQRTCVPVPKMFCLCEDESVIGRAFYVMEYIVGRVLWDQTLPGFVPAEREKIYDEMNRIQSALHQINYVAHGLEDFGKSGNYFERQITRWSKQYQASVTRPIPEMDMLIEWLPTHIPEMAKSSNMVSIVHGDYRLDNLVFHPTEARVIAVLDWELSTLGHPLADFSYHCMAWHIPPGSFRGIGGLDLKKLGIPSEDDYIKKYCERTKVTDFYTLKEDWDFYLAYNMFRLAAILQGIAKRVEVGTASSEQAIKSGAGAKPLAKMAWGFAQKSATK